MHTEIEPRDRERPGKELGHATLTAACNLLERQREALKVQTTKLQTRRGPELGRAAEGSTE